MKKLAIFLVIVLAVSCTNFKNENPPDPAYVQGVTSGEISVYDEIRVVFTEAVHADEQAFSESPFNLSPRVEGESKWVDEYTIAFKPAKPLKSDTPYTLNFKPASIGRSDIPEFSVGLRTIIQECTFDSEKLLINDVNNADKFTLSSQVKTSDKIEKAELYESLKVEVDGEPVSFDVEGEALGNEYKLVVDNLYKKPEASKLNVSFTKSSLKNTNGLNMSIPAEDDFIILSENPEVNSDGIIELYFSDLLDTNQNLDGLIVVEGVEDLQIHRKGNYLKLFSSGEWPGNIVVKVNSTVQNAGNIQLKNDYVYSIKVPTKKPEVRFIGKGTIIPTTQGTTVPIETMNLNSIMVEAVRIHGANMSQFLQVNNLSGDKEIHRVGEVVWQKIVDLDWNDENVDEWIRYGLDISPLLKEDPDGMYQIRLTFRYPHIEYPCTTDNKNSDVAEFMSFIPEEEAESSFWDNWDQNYNYSYRRERFNPCHPAYYQKWNDHNISVSKNVIISNIGIIARKSTDNTVHVALSDLRTTEPLSGSTITVYNFQNRVLKRTVSNRYGMAEIPLGNQDPFYLKVENNGQYGYLKLDDGNAISVSHFDVGGVAPQRGVQGFIYGERDVWRPGDTMYMTMILSDPDNTIPDEHPVTVELNDPFGKTLHKQQVENNSGFYHVPVETRVDFPTGTYTLKFHIGAIEFEKKVRIETIVPNRLKINLEFNDSRDYFSNGDISGVLSAKWLHGAIAGNLKADIKMNLRPVPTVFTNYEEYQFDDNTRSFSSKTETIFSGNLDSRGSADFEDSVNISDAPGALMASMTTRVFESGGGFSTEYFQRKFLSYDQYVGMKLPKGDVARGMLLTDVDHNVDIVLVDKDGNPVRNGSVTAEFYKVKWRWWWETDAENMMGFTSNRYAKKLKSERVNIINGKGQWTFRTNYPDWGRYYVRVIDNSSGHSAGKIVYIDWPGWAGRAQDEGSDGVSMLMLNTDKAKYNVGENVKVNIPGSSEGRCFITIENGGRILKSEWVRITGDSSFYQFRATAEMAPNVYIHASFVQPHLQTENDRPIRSYGVVPVLVEDPDSHLHPVISTSDTFRPGSAVRISVSEKSGKEMTYTLAVVDEGLLGLTRYQTPNPWNFFFRRRASLLKSFDLYDDVMNAFSGRLNTLLAIGGGDEGGETGKKKANRFEAVTIFEEPRKLAAGTTQSHIIKLPEYIGAVRVMVVAANDTAYGNEKLLVPVKKELMVLGSLPRTLGVNEEVDFPVSVFALDENIKDVDLTVKTSGPVRVSGRDSQSFRVYDMGEKEREFKLKTLAETGIGEIEVYAKAENFEASYKVEIDVRSPAPEITTFNDIAVKSGETRRTYLSMPGLKGTNSMSIELYQFPPLNLEHRLNYLIKYPHGCIEQTTSSVFPQLYLSQLTKLSDEEKSKVESNIAGGIERIMLFQTAQGGFSYWPGKTDVNQWGTNYGGHFLVEAKNKGYHVPENLFSNWLKYQKNAANTWTSNSSEEISTQAYRLYTLALAGESDLAAMNRLRSMDLSNHNAARWRLALAYSLSGQASVARSLITSKDVDVPVYTELSGTFGNQIRDKAMILEALVGLNEETGIRSIVEDISNELTSSKSLSTQTTAYSLIAMSKYGIQQDKRSDIYLLYRWGSAEGVISTNRPVISQEIDTEQLNSGLLEIENLGNSTIYPRIIMHGIPAPGQEQETDRGIKLDVSYSGQDGRAISLDNLEAGEDIQITVNVKNIGFKDYEEMILSHVVPSGWEIHNVRLSGSGRTSDYDYMDIRDDRVYTYFDIDKGKSKNFSITANVSYTGDYYLPLISCEAMYDPEILSVEPGQWLSVK